MISISVKPPSARRVVDLLQALICLPFTVEIVWSGAAWRAARCRSLHAADPALHGPA
jgi:hypothetical protein